MKLKFYAALLFSVILSFCFAGEGETVEFESLIGENAEIFQKADQKTFLARRKDNPAYKLFWWTSEDKTDARYPGYRNSPPLTWFGLSVCEVICRFNEQGKLKNIYCSFYNRGDAKEKMSDVDFQKLVKKIEKKLVRETGDSGKQNAGKGKLTSKNIVTVKIFRKANLAYVFKTGCTKQKQVMSPEFIQLELTAAEAGKTPDPTIDGGAGQVKKNSSNLAANVKKEEDGTVFIDKIPMVNQGDKGYCAVAVLERILRYYGNEQVNQHQIAELAASTAEQGTNLEDLLTALRKSGTKLGVRTRERYKRAETVKDFDHLLQKYNKAAKKMKKPQLKKVIRGNVIYISETLKNVDFDVWKSMRLAEKGDYRKFMTNVKTSVAKGIPMVWCVKLGLVEEEKLPEQMAGGHARLIIGYNDTKKTLIYSDTWGMGHEKKSMKQDDAWVITEALVAVDPRK